MPLKKATDAEQQSQLAAICTELMVHTLIEEEIFYPAYRGHMEEQLLEEAQVEHGVDHRDQRRLAN